MVEPLKTKFQSVADAASYLENEKFERVFCDDYSWISHDGLISAMIEHDDENKVIVVDYFG